MELFLFMLERVGLIIVFAFLMSRWRLFRGMLFQDQGVQEKVWLIIIFSALSIVSSYTGIKIEGGTIYPLNQMIHSTINAEEAIANTRLIGVAIAGIFGGPLVGVSVGIIAGIHRITLGGFTAVACGVSTILAGFITGGLSRQLKIRQTFSYKKAVMIGICAETLQMIVILIIAKPFGQALQLVSLIALPMIIMNALGILIFFIIIKTFIDEEERTKALQTHQAFSIAQQTIEHFRKGLNEESCRTVAEIIKREIKVEAVAITDTNGILAHVGVGEDHHVIHQEIITALTKRVLVEGRIITATSAKEINCPHEDCPLSAAIVLPLKVQHKTVGTLKLYFINVSSLTGVKKELAEGLSRLFSSQLEYAEIEQQRKLLKDAEIKALQAQVHPHFLFNSLNTISSLIRTDADEARALLIKLSTFFRSNLQGARQMLIPLKNEIDHVEAYLSIEQKRFPNRYDVKFHLDESLFDVQIPPFTLQPLVENAIYHAFKNRKEGKIDVKVQRINNKLLLLTEDNGCGMRNEQVKQLGKMIMQSEQGTGTALWNIYQRIHEIYGTDADFYISSTLDVGTKIMIQLPLKATRWE
ncbi:histidine kinase [Lysinibacillus sp. KCTC 33748]|uniref:sensor histidine kinase n=1 Tax=unclassified Lysinibacillus TaxID=2636778 RepID=UPI0009A65E75|nr:MULTISPECIES: sensor histidine kinase [unclassified Lysinibacillus]OXS74120.1 histidine kinase [Lysinibacillus sp. KCTC 33748]